MWHLVHTALQVIAGCAGLLLIYAALFLYEDEHGKLQNVLENWWINVRDAQATALSGHEAFMSRVAGSVADTFDKLFGEKLLSVRAAGVSICYSAGTYSLLVAVDYGLSASPSLRLRLALPSVPDAAVLAAQVGATAFGFFALGSVPVLIKDRRSFRLWALGSFAALLALMGDVLIPSGPAGGVIADLAFAGSFACDVVFIAITRWTLRWRRGRKSNYRVLALLALNFALAYFLVAPTAFAYPAPMHAVKVLLAKVFELQVTPTFLSIWLPWVGVLNAVDVLVSLAAFALALGLLAHRALWPVVHRPLYAVATSTGARKKTFLAAGLVLLGLWHPAILGGIWKYFWHYIW